MFLSVVMYGFIMLLIFHASKSAKILASLALATFQI